MKRIDLQLSGRARTWVDQFLSNHEPESVLALTYGPPPRWRFVVFTKTQAEQIEKASSLTGEDIYVTNDGLKLCISEAKDVERLAGGILDVVNGTFAVNGRAS